jgi:hypothetical protein
MPEEELTGTIYSINVPGFENWESLSEHQAEEIAKQYRWIYVNASLKGDYDAKDEATKLSNALNGQPMVHVYLSRELFDGNRNVYPGKFHATMRKLIKSVLDDGRQVLVTGRSYGVHQALRAAYQFNDPSILVMGIAPAFGAFGNVWSDNVTQYVQDIETTQCKYGMVASKWDGFTWKAGGAAYKRKFLGYRGSRKVAKAIAKNRDNVYLELINHADHAPIDDYIRHGLIKSMKNIVRHFDMRGLTDIVDVPSV